MPPAHIIGAVAVTSSALVNAVVGAGTDQWAKINSGLLNGTSVGIWGPEITTSSFILACRAFLIIGILCLVEAVVAIGLLLRGDNVPIKKNILYLLGIIGNGCGAVTLLLAIIIYAADASGVSLMTTFWMEVSASGTAIGATIQAFVLRRYDASNLHSF